MRCGRLAAAHGLWALPVHTVHTVRSCVCAWTPNTCTLIRKSEYTPRTTAPIALHQLNQRVRQQHEQQLLSA